MTDTLGQLWALIRQVQGALQGERRVRGTVSSAGAVTAGTGFSVSKISTGDYSVTFAAAFSAAPSIVAGNGSTSGIFGAKVFSPATTGFTVLTFNGTGAVADGEFHFIAVGP